MLNILTLAEYSFPTTREELQNIMAIPQAVSKMKVVTVTSAAIYGRKGGALIYQANSS